MNAHPAGSTCAFCRIATGEQQAHVVFQSELSLVFLDLRPLFPGHCLIIPREHYATLADLPRELLGPFFSDVQLLAKAVEQGMEAEGTFVAANNRVSQSIPHLHVHVVPRRKKDGLRGFFWPRQAYKDEKTIKAVQEGLRASIARIHAQL